MDKKTKALKLALEALEMYLNMDTMDESYLLEIDFAPKAITALREALAEQPAQGCEFCSHPLYAGTKCKNCGREQPAQQEQVRVPVTDNTYNYAKSLAEAIFKQHFASDEHYASGRIVWGVNDTVIGILTQIDNMVADMVRRPAQQQEPMAWMHNNIEGNVIAHRPIDIDRHPERWTALYPEPKPCPTCEALARTVMMDQMAHDTTPASKPLTDEFLRKLHHIEEFKLFCDYDDFEQIARAIEAAHGIKGDA